MDLIQEIDKVLANPSKAGPVDLVLTSFKIVNSTKVPSVEEIKKLLNIIEKLENNEDFEWLYTVQVLNYLEEINYEPDATILHPLISFSLKRIKNISETRHHINFGHFLISSEVGIRFLPKAAEYKESDQRVKQRYLEDTLWYSKNIDALDNIDTPPVSLKGITITKMKTWYFNNIARLLAANNHLLRQQNKALQRKAYMSLFQASPLDKSYIEACLNLIAALNHSIANTHSKSTVDARLKLYFSNFLYLFNFLNPNKAKEALFAEFPYDTIFLYKDDSQMSQGISLNVVFPYEELLDPTNRVSLQKGEFLSKCLYRMIKSTLNEDVKDEPTSINLFYIFRVIESILVSDTAQLKDKKIGFNSFEQGLNAQDYVKFSFTNKLLCLKLLGLMINRLQGYLLRNMDWITNAIHYVLNHFKENEALLTRVLKTLSLLLEVYGTQVFDFFQYLLFRGGKLFEITEKLFIQCLIKLDDVSKKPDTKMLAKKAQNKKKRDILNKGLSLELEEDKGFPFLDNMSKEFKKRLLVRLAQVLAKYFARCGVLETDPNQQAHIDQFAEMIMNIDPRKLEGLGRDKLAIIKLLEEIVMHNVTNNRETLIKRSFLDYLARFAFHNNIDRSIQNYVLEVKDKLAALSSSKKTFVYETETLKDIYSYYEARIKLMSDDYAKIEELSRTVVDEEPEEDELTKKRKTETEADKKLHDTLYSNHVSSSQKSGQSQKEEPLFTLPENVTLTKRSSVFPEKPKENVEKPRIEEESQIKNPEAVQITPNKIVEEALREEPTPTSFSAKHTTGINLNIDDISIGNKKLSSEVVIDIDEDPELIKLASDEEDTSALPKIDID